jgi:flavin reductase (DIM6/NTAB) family NADH-FMN oxidoreductase RutF
MPDEAVAALPDVSPEVVLAVHRKNVTGVAIVTALVDGKPRGVAVSAFASISLAPPLILVCIARTSSAYPGLFRTDNFAVNILSRDQLEIARRFDAGVEEDSLDGLDWYPGVSGCPILEGTCGYLEVETRERAQATTHTVFVGHVIAGQQFDRLPLVALEGRFWDSVGLPELS